MMYSRVPASFEKGGILPRADTFVTYKYMYDKMQHYVENFNPTAILL